MKVIKKSISELTFDPANVRKHDNKNLDAIKASLNRFGQQKPIVVDTKMVVRAGNGTLAAAKELGWTSINVVVSDLPRADLIAYGIADNRTAELAEWDVEGLAEQLAGLDDELREIAYSDFDLAELDDIDKPEPNEKAKLSDKFMIAPFSVFNARGGDWQNRKKAWIAKGINSIDGRQAKAINLEKDFQGKEKSGVSVFDPVLCEIAYTWFAFKKAVVLDPFAGGSVRGIMASFIGLEYHGVDIRQEQIEANEIQAKEIITQEIYPRWYLGDSTKQNNNLPDKVDLVFSCPPYGDLERYSNDPKDLSNMDYESFLEGHKRAVNIACDRLYDNRFAFWVVGDFRDKKGILRNFVSKTIDHFEQCGLKLYNEAILVTSCPTLPLRVAKQMKTRKLGKTHQNILIFVKGDPKKAAQFCGDIEIHIDEDESDLGS